MTVGIGSERRGAVIQLASIRLWLRVNESTA
jgi:hypothetical protein